LPCSELLFVTADTKVCHLGRGMWSCGYLALLNDQYLGQTFHKNDILKRRGQLFEKKSEEA